MLQLSTYRSLAVRLIEHASGPHGRSEDDPIYKLVTENRDVGKMRAQYSSCGDLAHWLLFRLGVRLPWINRDEHGGWRVGQNVMLLRPRGLVSQVHATDVFGAGDVLLIWSTGYDAHVMTVREYSPPRLLTGEYGQPGGAVREHVLTQQSGRLIVGRRFLQEWLPLDAVLQAAAASRSLVEPDRTLLEQILPGEELDALDAELGG